MRKRKFLSVLLAASMLASLLAGGVQAAEEKQIYEGNYFNSIATLPVSGGTVSTSAEGRPKLIVFTDSAGADGIKLTSDLNAKDPAARADVIVVFVDAAGTTDVTANHGIGNAKYVLYTSDDSGDIDTLYQDYASKIGISPVSPMTVLVTAANRVSLVTTGTGQPVTDAISAALGLDADSKTNCISTNDKYSAEEWELLKLINQGRGTSPLTICGKTQLAAHNRAMELVKSYSETRPDGTNCGTVFGDSNVGLTAGDTAENRAQGSNDPSVVFKTFQGVGLFNTNMYKTTFVHAGVACQYSNAAGYNWAVPLMSSGSCSMTLSTIEMPQNATTITNLDGSTTVSYTPKTFPTGTAIDDMGIVVHFSCAADAANAVDWICPLTSGMCTGYISSSTDKQTVTVTAYGQTKTFDITLTPANQTVSGISINKNAANLSFKEGDPLDSTGLELTVKYSSGATQQITSGFTCTPAYLNTPGTQTVTVSYVDKLTSVTYTATYKVEVAASTKVTQIEVLTPPTKTVYAMDDTLDTTGLTIRETLSDGKTTTTQTVTSGFTCSPMKLTTTGSAVPITVLAGGQTATFNVKVVTSLTVDHISVRTAPKKVSYIAGETVDTTGLVLNVTMTDGTVKVVSTGFTASPTAPATLTKDDKAVTITYEEKTTSYAITVADVTVSSIKVTTPAATLKYFTGDTFDPTGLVLTATMNNGTTLTVDGRTSPDVSYSPSTLDKAGTQTITASYMGKTVTFTVNVADPAVTGIKITTYPTVTGYIKGTSLVTTGMVLTASLANGKTQTVTEGYTCSPTKLSTVGTQTVTVTYKGKTATYAVSVVDTSVASLTVTQKPTKLIYYRGTSLVTTGMSLTAAMTDGTTKTVTSGFTCSPTTLTVSGTRTIIVTYGNASAYFTVTVNEPVVSALAVKTKPTKVKYDQGDYLDTTGLVLSATLADKSVLEVTSGYGCTPTFLKAAGTQNITVSYAGQTASFSVSVTQIMANAAFVDVIANQWFYNYINDLTKRGLLSGTDNYDGTYSFRPYSSITRAEFVAMLARASGRDLSVYYYSRFMDVPYGNWACPYVTWASNCGIVTGANGYFRPGDNITRQEMAVMLTRYSVYLDKSMKMDVLPVTFTDDGNIADWAKNSVLAMQKAGIIAGSKNASGSYSFRPWAEASRAEAAKVVSACLAK